MATKRKRRNPAVSDMLKGAALGPLIDKARQHVVSYYKKNSKGRKRRNPDIIMPSHLDHTMIPANDVANLLGGEFIPLKGMIINDNEVQLITEPGVRLANSSKTKLKKLINPKTKNIRTKDEEVLAPYRGFGILRSKKANGDKYYSAWYKGKLLSGGITSLPAIKMTIDHIIRNNQY